MSSRNLFFSPSAWLSDDSLVLMGLEAQGVCWRLVCMATSKRKPWRLNKGRALVAGISGSSFSESLVSQLLTFWDEDSDGVWTSSRLESLFPPVEKDVSRTRKKASAQPPSPSPGDDGFALHALLSQTKEELFSPSSPVAQPVARSEERKANLWSLGVGLLVCDGFDEGKARAFLGKHIHEYGEERMAEALATLSVRPVPPAEAKSFLVGILKGEASKRKRRGGVAL